MATGDGFVAFESPDDALAVRRRDPARARGAPEHGRLRAGRADRPARLRRDDSGPNFTGKGVHEARRSVGSPTAQIVASAETAAGGAFPTLDPRIGP